MEKNKKPDIMKDSLYDDEELNQFDEIINDRRVKVNPDDLIESIEERETTSISFQQIEFPSNSNNTQKDYLLIEYKGEKKDN
jgi:hypothetical protein